MRTVKSFEILDTFVFILRVSVKGIIDFFCLKKVFLVAKLFSIELPECKRFIPAKTCEHNPKKHQIV